jgi:serine/threonine protein kinase/class 3 adenylate cyclase
MMNFGGYRLVSQLGAGADGISYRAVADDRTKEVEVRDLSPARRDRSRWARVVPRIRLAAQLDHAAAIRIVSLALEDDPPHVVMEWAGTTTLESVAAEKPLVDRLKVPFVRAVAGALSQAHRLGMAHGRLVPAQVRVIEETQPKLDFTGLLVGFPLEPDRGQTIAGSITGGDGVARDWATERSNDLESLGALLAWISGGHRDRLLTEIGDPGTQIDPRVEDVVLELMAADSADRPTAKEVEDRLARVGGSFDETGEWSHLEPAVSDTMDSWAGGTDLILPRHGHDSARRGLRERQLGRYRLLERLGEGGQGVVYRALDPADGSIVAIKVLRTEKARDPVVLRRLRKEARLMAEANSPFVVNLLEYNEDGGLPYLVLEFVAGQTLAQLLQAKDRLDEVTAAAIMASVARGLTAAHERGIVHRDIKPSNILILDPARDAANARSEFSSIGSSDRLDGAARSEPPPSATPSAVTISESPPVVTPGHRIKISDFGLARRIVDSESMAVTAAGALVGTPHYMAPEQWTGRQVDSRTDVYAIGATLFHLVAGQPPFTGDTREVLSALHCNEPPPSLRALAPNVSDALSQIVETALAKRPEDRFVDAGAMLRHLENLLHGEPSDVAVHPLLPACDTRDVIALDFVWEMKSSSRELWPFVSNTERFNRAIGVQAPQFSARFDPERGVRRFARMHRIVNFIWEEHPFEWVEPRRFGVLREFQAGLIVWFMSLVELEPGTAGGTRLTQRIRMLPRGLAGKVLVGIESRMKMRKTFERVYQRIDAVVQAQAKRGSSPGFDPFEESQPLPAPRMERLERLQNRLTEAGVDSLVVERLGEHLARGADQEVARIRPLAFAERYRLDPDQVVSACLHGAREGLLVLHWDLLCPICRISCGTKDTLRAIGEHAHCVACNRDFQLDFANSIELIFCVHPEIREADLATYCIGGPAHSPHVFAQIRVAAGERIELNVDLPEGPYRLRGPQLPWSADFQVQKAATVRRFNVELASGPAPDNIAALAAGGQVLMVNNNSMRELVLRVERIAARSDALTAARAATLALFRELFPSELLAPGQLATVSTVTLLLTAFDQSAADALYHELGDARAFSAIHEQLEKHGDAIRQGGGAVVKTTGDGLLASFTDVTAAVRVALALPAQSDANEQVRRLGLRSGLHRGAALAATMNDHLDYFGTTSRDVHGLLRLARNDELILSQAVAGDPEVGAFLSGHRIPTEVVPSDLAGHPHVIRVRFGSEPAAADQPEYTAAAADV